MPTIAVPDDTYARLASRAEAPGTTVEALAAPALAAPTFNRVASFPTVANMAAGEETARETSAEIMTATEDGNTLIYSDSPLGVIGRIDITDPLAPKPLGNIDMDGEPAAKDAALIAAGQKVEHYEIAGYGTARTFAQVLGLKEVATLLEASLKEENAADTKLTLNSVS